MEKLERLEKAHANPANVSGGVDPRALVADLPQQPLAGGLLEYRVKED
jgi:hypothetical protein